MNFLRASGSLPAPFSNHWELFSIKTGRDEAVLLLSLSPHHQQGTDGAQVSISTPYMYSGQLLLLLNQDELKELSDAGTAGILLGKGEVYLIILQHLKYAHNEGLHSPSPRPQFSPAQSPELTKIRQQTLSQLE